MRFVLRPHRLAPGGQAARSCHRHLAVRCTRENAGTAPPPPPHLWAAAPSLTGSRTASHTPAPCSPPTKNRHAPPAPHAVAGPRPTPSPSLTPRRRPLQPLPSASASPAPTGPGGYGMSQDSSLCPSRDDRWPAAVSSPKSRLFLPPPACLPPSCPSGPRCPLSRPPPTQQPLGSFLRPSSLHWNVARGDITPRAKPRPSPHVLPTHRPSRRELCVPIYLTPHSHAER